MDTTTNSSAERRESRALALALVIVVCATVALAIIGFCFLNTPDEIIEGQADATSIRISLN